MIVTYYITMRIMSVYKFWSLFNQNKDKESNLTSLVENTDIHLEEKSKEESKKQKISRTVYDVNAPYDNVSVGAAGWFFGPMAGAILSYISLKNLGVQSAKYVLIGGILGTMLIGYLLMFIIPETSSLQIGFLWLIFMLLQQKQVNKWSKDNPDKKYKSGFNALGWGLVGGALLYIIFFVVALFFSPSIEYSENNIIINKEYPKEVSVGDTFSIEFSIQNTDKIHHKLRTIDLSKSLLDGILILNIEPKNVKEYDNHFGSYIYNFEESLSNTSRTDIVFNVKAVKKGDFSGDVDFCIDSEMTCLFDGIRIFVN